MDFITKKRERVENCPRCKEQSLLDVQSTSVLIYYENGKPEDTVWFFRNKDIKCNNCDFYYIVWSMNAGTESISEIMKDKYNNTNTAKMIKEALTRNSMLTLIQDS